MERTVIFNQVKAIIIDKILVESYEEDFITEESVLNIDLGIDSLDEVEIIIECEKLFEIRISDSEWTENVRTVKDIVDIIASLVK